jgi:hypothetical protein
MDPDADPETWKATEAFNRHGDNWRPLCAIADLAGGIWPKLTLAAVKALSPPGTIRTACRSSCCATSRGSGRALLWIPTGFEPEAISTDLVDALVELDGRPWAELGKVRKPLTPNRMAGLFEAFKVRPGFDRDATVDVGIGVVDGTVCLSRKTRDTTGGVAFCRSAAICLVSDSFADATRTSDPRLECLETDPLNFRSDVLIAVAIASDVLHRYSFVTSESSSRTGGEALSLK